MSKLSIYSKNKSVRLSYVLDWVFKNRLDINYQLTDRIEDIDTSGFFISYGDQQSNGFSIPNVGLLFEQGISDQQIEKGAWHNIPTLFASDGADLPFDIFSAIFFLITRYEEYDQYTPDQHGRYPATESVLYKNGWLQRPLVDEWIAQLRQLLISKNIPVAETKFQYQPTYDIDIAWSFQNKGLMRTLGATGKDLLKGNKQNIDARIKTWSGKEKDPYDSFEFLNTLHQRYNIKPIYFILAAASTSDFDKNISLDYPEMKALVKSLSQEGAIGIHPSYYSDVKDNLLGAEKNTLEKVIEKDISISRQHYIKNILPSTYRKLIAAGIRQDYSMGYGTHIGFRAGTGASFLWYDLERDEVSNLEVTPFCFMDTTAKYGEKLNSETAFNELRNMANSLKACGSILVTVMHNFSLGTDPDWKGWSAAYKKFISEYTP